MKQQGFLKGSVILLGTVLITKAIGLAYKIPLTHMLGGSGMAYYSGAFAVVSPLLAATVSGITASVARSAAESFAFGRYTHLRKVRRVAMLSYSLLGLLSSLLLAALAYPLAKAFLPSVNAVWTLAALAPSILFSTVLSVQRGYCEGLRNMIPTARSEIIETALKAVLGLAAAYAVFCYAERDFASTHGCFGQFCRTAEDARSLALPFAAAAAIFSGSLSTGFAVLYMAVSRRLKGDGLTEKMLASDKVCDRFTEIARRLLAHSLPIAGASVITTLSGAIDLITVPSGLAKALRAGMEPPAALPAETLPDFIYGSYTALALMVCGLVPTFTAMFGRSSLPTLTEAASRGDRAALGSGVSGVIGVSALIAFPCGFALAVLPEGTLLFLFAGRVDEIACSAGALGILGISCVFTSLALPCLSALQTLGHRIAPIVLMLLASVIKLLGNLLLIPVPEFGIRGAAIATAAGQFTICAASVLMLARYTGAKRECLERLLKPAFAALLAAAAAWLTSDLSARLAAWGSGRLGYLAALCAGAVVYMAGLFLLNCKQK